MTHFMLDTNTVSYLVRQHPKVVQHLLDVPMSALSVSAITAGELLFGIAALPAARRLQLGVTEFLERVDVLPWDLRAAERYGEVKATLQRQGALLGHLDLLIAAHALTVGAVLVTSDRAFQRLTDLQVEDWTR